MCTFFSMLFFYYAFTSMSSLKLVPDTSIITKHIYFTNYDKTMEVPIIFNSEIDKKTKFILKSLFKNIMKDRILTGKNNPISYVDTIKIFIIESFDQILKMKECQAQTLKNIESKSSVIWFVTKVQEIISVAYKDYMALNLTEKFPMYFINELSKDEDTKVFLKFWQEAWRCLCYIYFKFDNNNTFTSIIDKNNQINNYFINDSFLNKCFEIKINLGRKDNIALLPSDIVQNVINYCLFNKNVNLVLDFDILVAEFFFYQIKKCENSIKSNLTPKEMDEKWEELYENLSYETKNYCKKVDQEDYIYDIWNKTIASKFNKIISYVRIDGVKYEVKSISSFNAILKHKKISFSFSNIIMSDLKLLELYQTVQYKFIDVIISILAPTFIEKKK